MDLTKLEKGATVHYRDGSKATVEHVERSPTEYGWDVTISTDVHGIGLHKKDGRDQNTPRGETGPQDIVAIVTTQGKSSEASSDDIVNQPSHYARYKIEPVTFTMVNNLDFATGNIVKYSLRAGHKTYAGKTADESAIIDLQKVIRYAEMKINLIKGEDVL